ncbi:MAG: LysM peptidoglycan-binding domain-containing protein [Myxococcales bacterium]|nr:LysM peptidoglycan-binding domain-containing protein [Myxococcales bacterium]
MKFYRHPSALVLSVVACASVVATSDARAQSTVDDGRPSLYSIAGDRRSISISGETGRGSVPEFHDVSRGDTLWDITDYYFGNPWRWPAVWGLNPQITNPHWIFPNDRVRLLRDGVRPRVTQTTAPGGSVRTVARTVTPETVFHMSSGFLDPREAESSGTIVGSVQDHMLLTENDLAYIEFPRRTPRVGERFAVYQDAQTGEGDRNTGHVVRVIGTAEVTRWDNDRRVATARITEALDAIERGERVAVIPRTLRTVPPVRNAVDLESRIAATLRPQTFVGQHQVVFLDRGADDRVVLGNRFLVLRRGDQWRATLSTVSESTASGVGMDRDGDGRPDPPPDRERDPRDRMPEETVGELLVVEVRQRTCTAIVTSSTVELVVGDRAVMRRGY